MKKVLVGLATVLVLFVIVAIAVCSVWVGTYNSLVSGRQAVEASWGQVQNDYQRRYDLIPNLVSTVQGYANHEKNTLVEVTQARQQIQKLDVSGLSTNPELQKQYIAVQSQLSGALSRLLVVQERYPDLKANQNFLELQAQLEGTENRITVSRRDNQLASQSYNTLVQGFFSGIVAQHYHFELAQYFQADTTAQSAPKVNFQN